MRPRLPDYTDHKRISMPSRRFTERDGRILEHIHEFDGLLSDYQIQALEFTGKRQADLRLSGLFHNGFVNRTSRAGWTRCGCSVYWLTKKGAGYVAGVKGDRPEWFSYLKDPHWNQIEHDLRANDVTLSLIQAVQAQPQFRLFEWLNESAFRSKPDKVTFQTMTGITQSRHVIPDRFFTVDRKEEGIFRSRLLVELDLATHPNKRFANEKVIPGIAYIRSKAYESRFGANKGRWLVVTTSDKRLGYLKETTERAAGRDAVLWYFTTFEQVSPETVLTEPIWWRGGDDQPVALFPAKPVQ